MFTYLGIAFMSLGLIFFLGTVLGVHRFPDCYTRMHGAAKGDTLSSILFILGIIFFSHQHFDVVNAVRTAKLLFIIVFLFVASPAASHALVAAGYSRGLKPWQKRGNQSTKPDEEAPE